MPCDGWARNPARICDQDELRLGVTTAITGLVVGVCGLLRNEHGEDSIFDMRLEPTSDRVETVLQQNIGAGHLVHCQAYVASGTPEDRGIFVNARIVRESGAIDLPQMTLLAGYIDGCLQPSFPFGKMLSSRDGRGRFRIVTGTNPAAGAEAQDAVPAGALWRLHGYEITLVTDATVATRSVRLVIDDGTTRWLRRDDIITQTASQTVIYGYSNGPNGHNTTGSAAEGTLPEDTLMPAGHRVGTLSASLQAGDNYGAPVLYVEEWLIP